LDSRAERMTNYTATIRWSRTADSAFAKGQYSRAHEWAFDGGAVVAASKGFIDEVIMPHSTRRRVAMGLRKLRDKQLENPWKKHDNIPL